MNYNMILLSGQVKLIFLTDKGEQIMSKIINGKKYMLVDVVEIKGFLYDVYEDEQGNRKYICYGNVF